MADTSPLLGLISNYINQELLAKIAAEYGKGRLLLIQTTDLDAGVPVLWNIGAIAASGHPGAADVICRILLASASIPGAFPPVLFDVTANGKSYQEMHVDGGAVSQAIPNSVQSRRARCAGKNRASAEMPTIVTSFAIRACLVIGPTCSGQLFQLSAKLSR